MSLTAKEQKWADKLEKLLTNIPSKRIGLFTIGDSCLYMYNKENESKFDSISEDFCSAVSLSDSELGIIDCSVNIHSIAG